MTRPEPQGIAIVGLAGRFPGAANAHEFWAKLAAGQDCLTRLTDDDLRAVGYDPAVVRGLPGFVPVRGVIDRPEWFDRGFFGVPPREAEAMDPQHRVFLEVAWEALEDAGCDPSRYPGLIGVFAGMSNNTYFANFVRQRRDLLDAVGIVNAVVSNEKDFLTTRLAYKLDLRGPALNIQTACSSSLVAVAVACQQLLDHQCDAALAGGVSITFPQMRGYFYQEGGMTSGDGWCRPFDERANGTIFSSGAGVVVLKRVEDALAEGDQIYAVIRGQAVNNDGANKVSFAAPSIDGQAEVIALAQALAGVSPESISYLEAHGTATPLGDPIEVAALAQVFRAATERRGFCALGSVKGNVGHMDAASGVGSLIKTALAFRHEAIPPTINCETVNPALHLDETAFQLHRELRPWKRGAEPRRAGVNSLGVGGTNAHLVLEEAPERATAEPTRAAQLLVLSAKTATALEKRAADLAQHLEAHPELSLADVAFTLQTGRQLFAHRRAVVASDAAQAVERLRAPARGGRVEESKETATAFLFPGQGAQYARMGAQLYAGEPCFREALDRVAMVLEPLLGLDLRTLLFSEEPDAATKLRETRFTQPAIFAVDYAIAQFWIALGIQPAALVGHSVGEFVAATVAGVFTLEDAAHLVAERARLVQELPRGAMLAVRLNEAETRALAASCGVDVAAVNSPRLGVLAGSFEAIEQVEKVCAERSVAARRLETSHAFHSAMVEPVVAALEEVLATVPMRAPEIPILSTVTGEWLTAAEATSPRYWAAHARATVRFSAAAERLLAEGAYALLESGPGQGLTQLARQQPGRRPQHDFIPTIVEEADETESALAALGRLWAAGVPIDWAKVHGGDARVRVSLPAYPFERQRYFADLPAGTPLPYATAATDGEAPVEGVAATALDATPETAGTDAAETGEAPVLAQVKHLLADLSGLDIASAAPTTSLLELGFDSLFLTQIALALRKKFAVKLTLRQLMADLATLDQLAEYIAQNSTLKAAPAPAPVATPASTPLPAPEPKRFGPFKPIETGVRGTLTPRQQAHLDALIARYCAKFPESKRQTQASRAHLADPRTAGSFNRAWKEMVFPIVVERSAGARIWDIDGNEWIDMSMGFGTNLLGHAPGFVKQALAEQLERGIEVGPQTPLAGKVARLICELTGMERAAFCNTGSEAVMAAVRVARTVTGRTRIATTSGFHGINDEVLVRAQVVNGERRSVPVAPGIPEHIVKDVLVLEYGTAEALETLRKHAHELAAVLIEPVQSRRLGLQPREWLQEVRKITREAETALIFDELITGFRCHPGGAQALFGVKADIATYGKVIGGGMPIGVVAGSATYLDALDGGAWQYGDDSFPEVGVTFFAGTYVRHPLAIAGAHAIANYLLEQGPQLQERLSERTAALARRLNDFLARRGVPLEIQQFASLLYFQFDETMKYGSLLYFHLRERGVHLWEGRPFFLSTAHSEEDVENIARAFEESVVEMQRGGLLPGGEEVEEAPALIAKSAAPVSVPALAPAARGGMRFSLYYFGSYPAAYDPHKYKLVLEGAKFADEHGFEAVWIPERHFHPVGGFSPNSAVVAAALARETKRVQLRGGSVVLPLHHPVRVAEEWSVVDNLSNGRVGISIASGWHPNDFVLAPERFDRRRELCSEGIKTIQQLWRGETVPMPNAQGNTFGVKLHPLPQQAALPVWLTCIHAESYTKAGELGVNVLGYLMNQSVDDLAEKIRLYREARAKHGHDPAQGQVTVLMLTHMGENLPGTLRRARGPMREYLRSYLDNKQKRLDGTRQLEMDPEDVETLLDRSFEDYVAGRALVGTAESCAPIVEKLAAIGVDEIGCFIDFGVDHDAVLESLPQLDALRSRFAEHQGERELPLTASQAGLYALSQMGEDASRVYGESTTLELRGTLDVAALRRALELMPARHEALRTVVESGDRQRVLASATLEVPFADFSERGEAELKAFLAAQEAAPFDFQKPPLMRAAIVKIAPEHHLLVLTFHHVLGNGPSYTALVHDVIAAYAALSQGTAPRLAPAMQLSEYVAWQRAQDADDAEAERYWIGQFAGELPVLELPLDRPRPRRQSFTGGRVSLTLDAALTGSLRQMAARERASLFMVVYSAFTTLLHRLTGQDDVIVGVPFEGEVRSLEGGAALYANTTHMLPLRSRIAGGLTFSEYLAAQKQQVLDASEQQNYFFGKLVEKLQLRRDPSRSPLFAAAFNFENGEFRELLPGLEITAAMERYPHRFPTGTTTFELNMNVAECAGELVCQLDHVETIEPETAQRWLGHFRTLLESIAAEPARPVSRLPMLREEERALFAQWNDTAQEFAGPALVHALFEEQARRTPDAVAVIADEETLTYAELNARANRLARRLRALGVKRDAFVGVCLERSAALVPALLAVLKAGGAYVPLDPGYPRERLAFMAEDARLAAILSEKRSAGALPAGAAGVILLDQEAWNQGDANDLPNENAPEDLAYVIYTSGSTGRPKGALISHRAICNHLRWMLREFPLGPEDRVLQKATISFDASVWEVFSPLLAGAQLVVARPEGDRDAGYLISTIQRHGVTNMLVVPAMLRVLVEEPGLEKCTSLRRVFPAGEVLAPELCERFYQRLDCELINMYGPTECAVVTGFHRCRRGEKTVPIGRPISNTAFHVFDRELEIVPVGVAGELFIAGDSVGRGYLNNPELTAARFIEVRGERMYRTGDLVRWLATGEVEFLGRIDQQVKLRGFRIELGEIESALRAVPGIGQCAVVAQELAPGNPGLVAYYTRNGSPPPAPEELRETLALALPGYMVPASFLQLTAFPLTPSGKVDARALPLPASTGEAAPVTPRTATEAEIARIWQNVLGGPAASMTQDFFVAGGHSLVALQLIRGIRESCAVEVPIRELFESPTIAGLAAYVSAQSANAAHTEHANLVRIQKGRAEATPLFVIPGGLGADSELLPLAALTRAIGPELPVYGLKVGAAPLETAREMAAEYLAQMRAVQPHGPYLLLGECVGGVIAYEMARQLREAGGEVGLLALLDTPWPDRARRHWMRWQEPWLERLRLWGDVFEWRVRQPICGHFRKLAKLGWRERFRYFVERRARLRLATLREGEPVRMPEANVYVQRVMSKSPLLYPGKVTLLVSEESHREHGALGWDRGHEGPLEVHVMPGDHASYIRQNAATAAVKLRELIEQTQPAGVSA